MPPNAGPALREANAAGRLGLILYTIPGFPDPETYEAVTALLAERPSLSILETTFPVTDRFSEYANDTIKNAHRTAAPHAAPGLESVDHLRAFPKPVISVLYRATFEDYRFETVLDHSRGILDGLLFEWDAGPTDTYAVQARARDIELIQCAGNWMSREETEATLALTDDEPLVYLVSASATGAELYDPAELARVVGTIRAIKPDARIAAGFGIGTAGHVKDLQGVSGLHGVIIGTAFLKAMQAGFDAARDFLDSIEPALTL